MRWLGSAWPAAAWAAVEDVHLEVTNLTDTYLTGVRVELRFDDDRIICLDEEPERPDPPEQPHPFGEPIVTGPDYSRIGQLANFGSLHLPLPPAAEVSETWVQDDGTIVFAVGNLHPQGKAVGDAFWCRRKWLVRRSPPPGQRLPRVITG